MSTSAPDKAEPFPWESSKEYVLARSSLMACAYNAAVNYGSDRAAKKMRHLIEAINYFERVEGAAKLDFLVSLGVIDSYKPCPPECEMRPGGLFHAAGCENEFNTEVSQHRRDRARAMLPAAHTYAAAPTLVGTAR